jgi:hypothetical protein
MVHITKIAHLHHQGLSKWNGVSISLFGHGCHIAYYSQAGRALGNVAEGNGLENVAPTLHLFDIHHVRHRCRKYPLDRSISNI